MALDFSVVESTIAQTKLEVQESEAASAALDAAKAGLALVQADLASAQALVATAAEGANTQKADVVSGINAAIAALQDLLLQLQ